MQKKHIYVHSALMQSYAYNDKRTEKHEKVLPTTGFELLHSDEKSVVYKNSNGNIHRSGCCWQLKLSQVIILVQNCLFQAHQVMITKNIQKILKPYTKNYVPCPHLLPRPPFTGTAESCYSGLATPFCARLPSHHQFLLGRKLDRHNLDMYDSSLSIPRAGSS
jgi:hypothetical protein